MSDSNQNKKKIGFSTGALEKGNYRQALRWLRNQHVHNVELSALRLDELQPLIEDIQRIDDDAFSYISFHAPSAFPKEAERQVVELLGCVFERGWNIIVHPDVIRRPALWRRFGRQLLIENMDRRKTVARTADELDVYFAELPDARLCLDVAHARQLDTTLIVLNEIIDRHLSKIAEVHISELDSNCAHKLMSRTSMIDYRQFANRFRRSLPIIIESMLDTVETKIRLNEMDSANWAMGGGGRSHWRTSATFYSWHINSSPFLHSWRKSLTQKPKAKLPKKEPFHSARAKASEKNIHIRSC